MTLRARIEARLRDVLHLLDDDAVRAVQRFGDTVAAVLWDGSTEAMRIGDIATDVLRKREAIRDSWRASAVTPADIGARAWERDAMTGFPTGIGPRGSA